MSVLDQCIDIIDLTSLNWPEEERYSLVSHSFRVMGKAGNYDEMVVGLMHALYSASSSTRSLYHCDVDGDPEWKTALDLFVPPLKVKRFRTKDEVSDEYLLKINMPQGLTEEDRRKWMIEATIWTSSYEDYIWNIRRNRIARNVMIHKLEDMLDVLENPGRYKDEPGSQCYVLPWKKHQVIGVRHGGSCIMNTRIPDTDDVHLFRRPTDEERRNLIEKYGRALEILQRANDLYPIGKDFKMSERRENEKRCRQGFLEWRNQEEFLKEISREDYEEREYESEDLPF